METRITAKEVDELKALLQIRLITLLCALKDKASSKNTTNVHNLCVSLVPTLNRLTTDSVEYITSNMDNPQWWCSIKGIDSDNAMEYIDEIKVLSSMTIKEQKKELLLSIVSMDLYLTEVIKKITPSTAYSTKWVSILMDMLERRFIAY